MCAVTKGAPAIRRRPSEMHRRLERVKRPNTSLLVASESLGRHRKQPLASLFMSGRDAKDVRPQRPRIAVGPRVGRTREQLELIHGPGTLPVHRAQAVGAGVAAADDDRMLVFGGDEPLLWNLVPFVAAVLERKGLQPRVEARPPAT